MVGVDVSASGPSSEAVSGLTATPLTTTHRFQRRTYCPMRRTRKVEFLANQLLERLDLDSKRERTPFP
jgi:hypothetical protein